MTNIDRAIRSAESKTDRLRSLLNRTDFNEVRGRVTHVVGTLVRATIAGVRIGDVCWLVDPVTQKTTPAEVVGFSKQEALLTPLGDLEGLSAETEVVKCGRPHEISVGDQLLGRVLDGMGAPIDDGPELIMSERAQTAGRPPPPLTRALIDEPIHTGIKAIDGLLTCGVGQRLGVFAAAGVGKSSLLSMITRNTNAEVVVIGMIGERGREVRSFIERDLGKAGMRRAVVVVATSDRPSMERVKAAYVATSIAEHFRDQGKHVLLLVDSVTRFARALREIGLAAGEPPARRGFPPSVFATLPKLLERTGPAARGSITAFYTVLVEGDDMSEPVADEVRSLLDGHIVLSRPLAESGRFPAIDVLASNSRLMNEVTSRDHQALARSIRQLMAKYQEIELLVQVGEYQSGQDPMADAALLAHDLIERFLRQAQEDEATPISDCLSELEQIVMACTP